MSGTQVAQGQERFVKPIGGYTEDQTTNKVEYVTGQNVGGKKRAMDTVVYGTYPVSTANVIAVGSTTRIIKKVAHGARLNDLVQFTSGNNSGIAIQILSCPDADTMIIAATPEFTSAVGDTFDIKRYVSPQYAADGSLAVTASVEPLQIKVDGVATDVNVDTITPANTVRIPVEMYSASGLINITAGDINVQLTDTGANPDVTKIGDGTNRLGINAATEALVHDADVLAGLSDGSQLTKITDGITNVGVTIANELMVNDDAANTQLLAANTTLSDILLDSGDILTAVNAINAKDLATQTTLAALLTELQLKADLLETQPVSMASAPTGASLEATQLLVKAKTDNLDVALSTVAKDATLLASNVLIGAVIETAPATDTASSGLNGRLQRIAQNITSLIALLPASLGIKTAAASLSMAPASDAVFATKDRPMTASFAEDLAISTVVTISAPANAIAVLIQADDTNSTNIRVKQGGGTSTTTSGIQFQGGRSEKFDCGTDLSVCSESGTNKMSFQWFLQT